MNGLGAYSFVGVYKEDTNFTMPTSYGYVGASITLQPGIWSITIRGQFNNSACCEIGIHNVNNVAGHMSKNSNQNSTSALSTSLNITLANETILYFYCRYDGATSNSLVLNGYGIVEKQYKDTAVVYNY